MERTLNQAKKWWDERSFGQKFSLMFLSIALVAILTYLFTIGSQPDWDVLYDELSESSAAAVASHLKESGIAFKITNDGKTILVPKSMIEQTRLDAAEADVIKDGVASLADVEKMSPVLTKEQMELWKKRITQGELETTIIAIKGVKKAKINIAEPERSVFSSEDESPSASVMLTMEPGARIEQEKVKAIKNLVSHSIPKLSSEKVFVADQFGKSLSDDVSDSSETMGDIKTLQEKSVEKKVKEVLSKLVGNGNVSVAVTAYMNFDRQKSTVEQYIPSTQKEDGTATGVLISEQVAGEKYTGQDGKATGGVPGTASNISNPTYGVAGASAGGAKSSDYNKNNITQNYEVSKETKEIVYAPGEIERLTVAVVINRLLTSSEREQIEKLVATAAGIDEARGDSINVTAMGFDEAEDPTKLAADQKKDESIEFWLKLAKTISPILLITIFGGSALAMFWSLIKQPVEAETYEEEAPMIYDYPEAPELLEAASIPVIEAKLDPEIERMRSEINTFVMNDPAEAARLLLTYIKE